MLCLPDGKRQATKTKLTGCAPNLWRHAKFHLNIQFPDQNLDNFVYVKYFTIEINIQNGKKVQQYTL